MYLKNESADLLKLRTNTRNIFHGVGASLWLRSPAFFQVLFMSLGGGRSQSKEEDGVDPSPD